MIVDLLLLESNFLFFAHAVILLNSVFVEFSAPKNVFPLVISMKSLANAMALDYIYYTSV